MRKIARIAAYLILMPIIAAVTMIGGLVAANTFVPAAHAIITRDAHPSACTMMINAGACLDPSNIDDYRSV